MISTETIRCRGGAWPALHPWRARADRQAGDVVLNGSVLEFRCGEIAIARWVFPVPVPPTRTKLRCCATKLPREVTDQAFR
jgi:hypothetical protein